MYSTQPTNSISSTSQENLQFLGLFNQSLAIADNVKAQSQYHNLLVLTRTHEVLSLLCDCKYQACTQAE